MKDSEKDVVALGQFGRPYGLLGWQFFAHATEDPLRILQYAPLLVQRQEGSWQPVAISAIKRHQEKVLIKAASAASVEDAAAYRHAVLGVERQALPEPQNGSYYWHDLIGLEVVNVFYTEDSPYGEVRALHRCGGADVLEVKLNAALKKGKYAYVPFARPEPIQRINLKARTIHIRWDADF